VKKSLITLKQGLLPLRLGTSFPGEAAASADRVQEDFQVIGRHSYQCSAVWWRRRKKDPA